MSSPVVIVENGQIAGLDVWRNSREWERLQRDLVFRVIREHPIELVAGLPAKLAMQVDSFAGSRAMSPANIWAAALMTVLGGLAWLAAWGAPLSAREVLDGAGAGAIVLLFATTPALIEPSMLSVGMLLSCVIALAIAPFALAALARSWLRAEPGERDLNHAANDVSQNTMQGADEGRT
jgi:hypothetical protein